MVPNGEAIKWSRQRCDTPGCCANSAVRSWYPTDVGISARKNALNQKGADGAPIIRTRDAVIYPVPQRLQRNAHVVIETRRVWRECDGLIYCRVIVANALIAHALRGAAKRFARSHGK